jgi:hypothetical protein
VNDAVERIPEHWSCPHEVIGDGELCPFHDDDADPETVRDAFDRALTDGRDETNSFVGAKLPDLWIDDEYLRGDTPLDLRAVTFTETLNLEDTRFAVPVRFEGARFEGRLELDDTEFRESVTFYGCRFEQVVEGKGTTFGGEAYFLDTSFRYSFQLKTNVTFEGDAFFTRADIESNLLLENTTFEKQAFFHNIGVDGRASFDRTTFDDDARFAGAEFGGPVSLEHAECRGVLQFGGRGIDRRYDPAIFHGRVTLEHVECHDSVYFVGCEIQQLCELTKSRFDETVDLSETALVGSLNLSRSRISELHLTPAHTVDHLLVECVETELREGSVEQPTTGALFCHFERATVGRVEFYGDSTVDAESPLSLHRVRFVDTTFEGFDFTGYRRELEEDGDLVAFDDSVSVDSLELDPTIRERTYQRAKSGANDIGDDRVAGSFFVDEMKARGERHREDVTVSGSLRFLGNQAFRITSKYAESPARVVLTAILVIVAFALVYAVGFSSAGLTPPYPNAPLEGYLLLSAESFVTLVHTPAATVASWPVRLLAASEGFLGAFLIAYFLFTLTRAVHR